MLDQYRAFWRQVTPASRASTAARSKLLGAVAVDPELHSLLRGIAQERARGRAFYGVARLKPSITQLLPARGIAVIDDCQDASTSGVISLTSNRRLTVGAPRDHVTVTMHRGADGIWRVAFVAFPKAPC